MRILRTISFLLLATLAHSAVADEALWNALKSGRYVVFIRHAVTEPGVGDPPGFSLSDCTTQRNLSTAGKQDAAKIGEAFRRREIPVADVLSSRWCRCLDTAKIAFGRVRPDRMLDSMFNDRSKPDTEKLAEVTAAIARRPSGGNLVLVTHAFNIQAHTGVSASSGEIVVAAPQPDGKLKVIGRIEPRAF